MRASLLLLAFAVGLTGCTPPADDTPAADVIEEPAATDTIVAEEAEASPTTAAAPSSYGNTAWRSTAENGALFATYLDAGGTYRELRNGDPYQTGSWTYGDDGQLCLVPDGENTRGGCWTPQRMSEDGKLILANDAGERIELTRITYEPPVDDGGGEESGG